MKVLHVIDCMRIGGAQRRLFQLLKGLQSSEGIRNYLVLFSNEIDFVGLNKLDAEIIIIRSEKLISYESFKEFRKIVAKINPDIIHSWQLITSFYATLLSFAFKFKHLNAMINDSSNRGFFDKERLLTKAIIPFADIIVSNSKAGLAAYKVKRKRNVFVIYNGFDFERLGSAKDVNFDSFFNASKQDVTVLGMVARFDYAKDYPTVIEAICSLLERGKKIKFIAVGDGSTLEECKCLVPPKYKDHFFFTGKRGDIDEIVPLFDIGVLSTFTEGISNSIMEYMAFKKPVVATDCPGNREIVVDGHTGLLVKSRDKNDWMDKLSLLIENKEMQSRYGMSGFCRLKECFYLDKMILQYTDLYSRLSGKSISLQSSTLVLDAES
jgi:glycosyltransferase involved in cell wall biosynthesis